MGVFRDGATHCEFDAVDCGVFVTLVASVSRDLRVSSPSERQHMIRPTTRDDLPALKSIIEATEMFPPDMLDGMIEGFFSDPATQELWFTFEDNAIPLSVVYCAPETLTEGTFNAYLLTVSPDHQGQGIGRRMMTHLEDHLRIAGARVLLVETSGVEAFEPTRTFYRKCGFEQEACIRDFYAARDDKIIFRKAL